MGKPMNNDTVIYGQGHGIDLEKVNWATIQKVVEGEVGDVSITTGINNAKAAVAEAKNDTKLKNPYVKVGVVGRDLVFRIKDKRTLVDKEIDTVLLKGFVAKQLELQREEIDRANSRWRSRPGQARPCP